MPFHVFLAQSLSLVTGGLDVWKLAKDALLLLVTMFTICLVYRKGRATKEFSIFVIVTAAYAALHVLLWLLHPAIYRNSAVLGVIYNIRVPLYMVLGWGAGLLFGSRKAYSPLLIKIILIVSTTVVALGFSQYVLPNDFLTHVGYGVDRGTLPSFFIDSNVHSLMRIMSTLRDPNSLGAFLIIPITLLVALVLRASTVRRRIGFAALLALHCLALLLTFGRADWAATLLAVGLLLLWQYRSGLVAVARRWWLPLAVAGLVTIGGVAALSRTAVFKSVVTHSTGAPKNAYDSNGFHLVFAERGLWGIVRNPFGHGPGTAGLASIQNPKGSFLTENYYIQIGYEVGVLGLLLFVALNAIAYRALWRRRDNTLAAVLLAAFWAYVLVNMLLHMWSNEAVAAQWWIVAGLVIALPVQVAARKKR